MRATSSVNTGARKKLERLCLKDRRKSAPELNKEWMKATGFTVTPRTANNRLLDANLPARTPHRNSSKPNDSSSRQIIFIGPLTIGSASVLAMKRGYRFEKMADCSSSGGGRGKHITLRHNDETPVKGHDFWRFVI